MAGDLVQRSDIQHTFAHDLESFFWVLLWIVLTRVKFNYDNATERSTIIHNTMNPRVCDGSGGYGKINFLLSPFMFTEGTALYSCLPNKPLRTLLVQMKLAVADRYCRLGSKKESPPEPEPESESEPEPEPEPVSIVSIALERDDIPKSGESYDALVAQDKDSKLPVSMGLVNDHQNLIKLFDRLLERSSSWPSGDKAEFQPINPSSSEHAAACSGSKRSRCQSQLADSTQSSRKRHASG
jgi:Fungal protein kinase